MNRFNRRNAISAVTASAATISRLNDVLKKLGADAQLPSPAILSAAWRSGPMAASRNELLTAVKAMAGGTAGFDYGPLGKQVLVNVCLNWLDRYADPLATYAKAISGQPVAPVSTLGSRSKPKAKAPAAPVAAPQPTVGPVAAPAPAQAPSIAPQPAVQPIVPPAPDVVIPVSIVPTPPVIVGPSPAEVAHPEWNWQDASVVFGLPTLGGKVAVWPKAGDPNADPDVPDVDDKYVWTEAQLRWAIYCCGEYPAKGVWLWGTRGAGKTVFAEQFAARTGRPFFPITFTEGMEPMDFIGDMGAVAGSSVWQDGVMTTALESKIPAVILTDEISVAKPGHLIVLNDIVHPKCSFRIPRTSRRIRFCKSHFFVAADNTNGTGDPTNMYEGTKMMNRSTMDRFSHFLHMTHPPKGVEIQLLINHAFCSVTIAEKVWGVLDTLRQKVASSEATDPPSIREAIALASALRAGFDPKEAFETSFVGKYPDEMQEDMRLTFTAAFNGTAA